MYNTHNKIVVVRKFRDAFYAFVGAVLVEMREEIVLVDQETSIWDKLVFDS